MRQAGAWDENNNGRATRQLLGRAAVSDYVKVGLHSDEEGLYDYSKVIDELNNRFPDRPLNVAECYVKGYVDVVADFRLRGRGGHYQLVIRAIPQGADERSWRKDKAIKLEVSDVRAKCDERSMLVGLGEFVENPKAVIPSLVWLEEAHNGLGSRVDYRGGCEDGFFKTVFRLSKDKTHGIEGGGGVEQSYGRANSLIERGPKIVNRVCGDREQVPRGIGRKPNLVEIASGIRVFVHDIGVRIIAEERLAPRIEFLSVFPSAIK